MKNIKDILKRERTNIEHETVYVFVDDKNSYKRGKIDGMLNGVLISEVVIFGGLALMVKIITKRA